MYYDYFQFGITETHFVMRQQRNVVSPPLYLSLPLSVSVAVASFPVLGATQHRGACEINLCNYVTVTAAAPGTERNRVALGEKERAGCLTDINLAIDQLFVIYPTVLATSIDKQSLLK